MSVLIRWVAWFAGGLVVVMAIISIQFLLWMFWLWVIEPPAVPLTAGLAGTWDAMSSELDQRVKASFPVGSLVAGLETQLRQQGFTWRELDAPAGQERVAVRKEDSFPCAKSAFVFWQADSEGHLTSVGGKYPAGTCL